MLHPGESLDGYRLIRPIGSGGFGEVWLCQSDAMGDFRALKFIPATNSGHLEKEFDAVRKYRSAAGQLQSPAIMSIEHVNRRADGLFYVMPLSDGYGDSDPTSPAWYPLTMAVLIERRRTEPTWFSSEEIRALMAPILQALQLLSNAGLVHRDVKPENILFLNGVSCLGDMSLLGNDSIELTRRGTPGYSAPSWFVETGGHPDMYGAAMTLYAILSGNPPDKMGRAAFRWPPQGEKSLSTVERKTWLAMHASIRRAVEDRASERFADFLSFERNLAGKDSDLRQKQSGLIYGLGAGVAALLFIGAFHFVSNNNPQATPSKDEAPDIKGGAQVAQVEVQKVEEELATARQAMLYDRTAFAKSMDGFTAELKAIVKGRDYSNKAVLDNLKSFEARFVSTLDAIPKRPTVETKTKAVQQLRALAENVRSKIGDKLARNVDRAINDFERELESDKEFRGEQIAKIRQIAVQMLNESIALPSFKLDMTEAEQAADNERMDVMTAARNLAGDIVTKAQNFWW